MSTIEMISLLGIIAGLAIFVIMSIKGFQLVITAWVAAIAVILTSGQPIMEMITETWANGFVGFIRGYFLIMALGALIGKLMSDAGAAKCIARALYRLCKNSRSNQKFIASLFVPIMYVILCYAGINGLVIVFTVVGIAAQIMREFDVPWRFYSYGGVAVIACNWIPGSLAIPNIIAGNVSGSTLVGNLGLGLVATIVYLSITVVFLYFDVKRADRNGEGFLDTGAAYAQGIKPADEDAEPALPSLIPSVLPLVAVIVLAVFIHLDILIALFLGNVLAVVLYWKYLPSVKKSLGDGVTSCFGAVIGVGVTSAVASVISASAGFQVITRGLGSLPPILAGIAYVVVFSFITASPSGALNGVGPVAMDFFNGLGLSAGTSAKLLGLSTFTGVPPHSSGIATGVMVCKFEYKKIIGIYVKVPLVAGIAAIAACLLMIQFGI